MTERMIVDEISNIIRQHSGEAACRLAERIIAAIQAHLDAAGYAVVPKEPYARVRIGAVKLESL